MDFDFRKLFKKLFSYRGKSEKQFKKIVKENKPTEIEGELISVELLYSTGNTIRIIEDKDGFAIIKNGIWERDTRKAIQINIERI